MLDYAPCLGPTRRGLPNGEQLLNTVENVDCGTLAIFKEENSAKRDQALDQQDTFGLPESSDAPVYGRCCRQRFSHRRSGIQETDQANRPDLRQGRDAQEPGRPTKITHATTAQRHQRRRLTGFPIIEHRFAAAERRVGRCLAPLIGKGPTGSIPKPQRGDRRNFPKISIMSPLAGNAPERASAYWCPLPSARPDEWILPESCRRASWRKCQVAPALPAGLLHRWLNWIERRSTDEQHPLGRCLQDRFVYLVSKPRVAVCPDNVTTLITYSAPMTSGTLSKPGAWMVFGMLVEP